MELGTGVTTVHTYLCGYTNYPRSLRRPLATSEEGGFL